MKRNFFLLSLFVIVLAGCGEDEGSLQPQISGPNVLPINVGRCGLHGYANEPCVDVTICSPGTNTCQTISNVLLDTGSYGLRVFSSLVTVPLETETNSRGESIAQCAPFADGASEWGPIKRADIIVATEKASSVPIQIVDSQFSQIPSDCTHPDTAPDHSGFNGILGVGPLAQDCGPACATSPNNRVYFACTTGSCTGTILRLEEQVTNPIFFLPQDNNGIAIQLPAVPPDGARAVMGSLVLGIGTHPNNSPTGVQVFPSESNGTFTTQFNGQTYSNSVIDSGSNGIFFPPIESIPECGSEAPGFYCPSSTLRLSATQIAVSSPVQENILFQIGDAVSMLDTRKMVFNDLAGAISHGFDWGLPFFLGKTIYFGYEGKESSLSTGPFFAY